MKKSEAVKHFGSEAELARFLGVTRAAINKLPENLSLSYTRLIIGAMKIAGVDIPESWLDSNSVA